MSLWAINYHDTWLSLRRAYCLGKFLAPLALVEAVAMMAVKAASGAAGIALDGTVVVAVAVVAAAAAAGCCS